MSSLGSLKEHFRHTQNMADDGQKNTSIFAINSPPDALVAENISTQRLIERRANATLVLLCRNSDLEGTVDSIRQMEDRFNKKYKYPWVLLNDEPFTDNFKRLACSAE